MSKKKVKFILSPIVAIAMLAVFGVQYTLWKTEDTVPPTEPGLELHRAVRENNFKEVESLVQKGFDVNKEDSKGITPFIEAVLTGDKPTVVLMMRNGAMVQPKPGFRHTPLRAACLTGNIEFIQMLLREGADPNAKSEGDRTPLMGACFLRPGYGDELSFPAVQGKCLD